MLILFNQYLVYIVFINVIVELPILLKRLFSMLEIAVRSPVLTDNLLKYEVSAHSQTLCNNCECHFLLRDDSCHSSCGTTKKPRCSMVTSVEKRLN